PPLFPGFSPLLSQRYQHHLGTTVPIAPPPKNHSAHKHSHSKWTGPCSCRAHCGNFVENITVYAWRPPPLSHCIGHNQASLTLTCIAAHPSPRRVGTYYITALEQCLLL
ncbi:hypothetical protein CH063_14126, partial [Colletotrichum higginsianum]